MSVLTKAEDGLAKLNAVVLKDANTSANQKALAAAKEDLRTIAAEAKPTPPPVEPPTPPAPPVEPTPPVVEAPLFAGTKLSQFGTQIDKGSITEEKDPLGSGETVFAFEVKNEGLASDEGGSVCRAQALCPDALYVEGVELWEHWGVLLPVGFPTVASWMTLNAVYGPPYDGASPFNFALETINASSMSGEYLCARRNPTYSEDVPWAIKAPRGEWIDVLVHQKFSKEGWIELWINGIQITFFDGSTYNPKKEKATTKLAMKLIDSTNNGGPNQSKIMQYRALNAIKSTATVFHKPLRIGKTRASVGG